MLNFGHAKLAKQTWLITLIYPYDTHTDKTKQQNIHTQKQSDILTHFIICQGQWSDKKILPRVFRWYTIFVFGFAGTKIQSSKYGWIIEEHFFLSINLKYQDFG